ncbi:MAG TPA: nucleoside deaminase [Candidatus Limnocylindria bacterium]|nr:nucleoside deaminase [Candidatus Limnocylindria bacterium]
MSHEDYIRLAIQAARESEGEGGIAIGAVLVKNGKVVATGKSFANREKDPSDHAEVNGIRKAGKKLNTIDLDNCILYSTLEPCTMCVSCTAWANVPKVYFGAYRTDVPENAYEINGDYSSKQFAQSTQRWDGQPLQIQGGILRQECKELLAGYKNWQKEQD